MDPVGNMEEEDSDWDTGPTIEEIISSLSKRQSKFGIRSSLQSYALPRNKDRESSSSPEENPLQKSKTSSLSSYVQKSTGSEAKTSSSNSNSLNPSSTHSSHGQFSRSPEATSSDCCERQLSSSLSNLRMARSVSTPEMRSRYMMNSLSASKVDNQHVGGLQNKNFRKLPSQHEQAVLDKENKKPYFTALSKITENDPNDVNLAKKTDYVPKFSLNPSGKEQWKEMSGKSIVHTQVENEVQMKLQSSMISSKRELCPSTSKGIDNVRPSKVANTLASPLKIPNTLSDASGHSPPNAMKENLHRNVMDKNSRLQSQPVTSSAAVGYNNPLVIKENKFLSENGKEVTNDNSIILLDNRHSKQTCQNSVKEYSAPPQQVSDHGYSSGNSKCNTVSSKIISGDVPNVSTPSAPCQSKFAVPSSCEKLKQMDHIEVNGHSYLKLTLLGRGGSSKVYEVLDVETRKVKAIKMVELEGLDEATLKTYENEIDILKRLQFSDRVIKLFDFEKSAAYLKLVMERGNQDLASVLSKTRGSQRAPISPFTIKHYWQGMLLAVQAIHSEGIIHSDLKPANFVLVNETVKLIDFGIASSIQQDMTSIIKDSQGGTFNYMSPESVLDVHNGPIFGSKHSGDKVTIKIGVKSDVWSLGCILYNLVYGHTPFQHISNPLKKLAAISDSNMQILFKEIEDKHLEEVMRLCLQFEPRKRPSIQQLLQHPYLTGENSNDSTPAKSSDVKSAIDQLVKLTPNSFHKITSMMQQLKSDT